MNWKSANYIPVKAWYACKMKSILSSKKSRRRRLEMKCRSGSLCRVEEQLNRQSVKPKPLSAKNRRIKANLNSKNCENHNKSRTWVKIIDHKFNHSTNRSKDECILPWDPIRSWRLFQTLINKYQKSIVFTHFQRKNRCNSSVIRLPQSCSGIRQGRFIIIIESSSSIDTSSVI